MEENFCFCNTFVDTLTSDVNYEFLFSRFPRE